MFGKKGGKWGAVLGGLAGLALAPVTGGMSLGMTAGVMAGSAGLGASIGEKIGGGSDKFWNTHFGRKGLFSEGGEKLGLWKSGTTVDRENRAVDAVEELRAQTTERHNQRMQTIDEGLLANLNKNSFSMDNIDFSDNRSNHINRIIEKSINTRNEMLTNTIQTKLNAEESFEDRMVNYDREIENIRA